MPLQVLTRLNKPENIKLVLTQLPVVVSFALLILCIHVLSQLVWTLLSEDESIATTKVIAAKVTPDINNQKAYEQLLDANLFGQPAQKKINVTRVPETRLNLFLKGVFTLTPMAGSTAIIASGKNGKEESYGIGDKLPGGVTIVEIHSDHVILERRSQFEILRMPESKGVGIIAGVIPDLRGVRPLVSDEVLDVIRNKIIANPYSLRDYALAVVAKVNDKQIGYRLKPQQKGGILYDIGIEPDDIVTAVNGVRLNDPKNATKALRELITAKDVGITVRRGKDDLVIRVELQ